jgi:hypothetical protein
MKAERMPKDHTKILKDFEGGFISTSGTSPVSAKETTYKGYVARTMIFGKDNKRVRGLAFIAGTRLMGFFVTTEGSNLSSPDVTKFFNSIKINGK